MTEITSLCVYCGSSLGQAGHHREAARRLGAEMARRGMRLVYGGGRVGLMGVIADAVLAGGGRVVGVIPEHLRAVEVGHQGLSELEVVDSMHSRKRRMAELADGFAVLSGGLGTLDETIEIITWKQLGLHDKPIVIADIEGYWRPLGRLVDAVIAGGFARPDVTGLFTFVDRVDAVLPALEAARAPRVRAEPERM